MQHCLIQVVELLGRVQNAFLVGNSQTSLRFRSEATFKRGPKLRLVRNRSMLILVSLLRLTAKAGFVLSIYVEGQGRKN